MATAVVATPLAAQPEDRCPAAADTVRGVVGDEIRLPLRIERADTASGGRLEIEGSIVLGNPTVFLPERFVALGGDSIVASAITLLDTRFQLVYRFRLTLQTSGEAGTADDTLVMLAGEALAGNDSCTLVTLDSVTVNTTPADPVSILVLTRSIGTPFPYIRFATLEPGVPNPSKRGDVVSFGFRIDKDSEVEFRVYTITGAEVHYQDLGYLEFGSYSFTFPITYSIPSGPFVVRMSTNTGDDYEMFHVIK